MVTAYRCQRLRQTIADNHIDSDGMDKFLDMSGNGCASSGEEMSVLQTQFLTNQREHGAVQHLILQVQGYRWFLATTDVFDVMLATDIVSMHKELTLYGTGMFYLIHHTHVDLLPETGYCRHTSGMGLTHGLLHLLRMGIDNHRGTLGQGKEGPSALEDMGVRKEVHHTVVLTDRHALVVGLEGSMILSVRQDDALGIACGTAGVQDIGDIVERSFLLQSLYLRLTGQVLA